MPYLDIHANKINHETTRYIAGVMLFPNEPEKRSSLEIAHRLDASLPVHLQGHVKRIIEEAARKSGSIPTLVGSQLLLTIMTDREISSLRLTREAFDLEYQNRVGATSETSLENGWAKFKNVAHLWAAQCLFNDAEVRAKLNPPRNEFPCIPQHLSFFLSCAEAFRVMGENFRSSRAPKGKFLLQNETTWKMPEGFPLVKNCLEAFSFDSRHYSVDFALKERTSPFM